MNRLTFVPISEDGSFKADFSYDAREVEELSAHYEAYYKVIGHKEPWLGYFAVFENQIAGVCGFKGAPKEGLVEIAYYVFPRFEGQGIATEMALKLVRIARSEDRTLTVSARTLPEHSASTSVLEKAGFRMAGTVRDPEEGPVWEWYWKKTQIC